MIDLISASAFPASDYMRTMIQYLGLFSFYFGIVPRVAQGIDQRDAARHRNGTALTRVRRYELAREVGMLKLETVARDSTKIAHVCGSGQASTRMPLLL
jgi:hypothetical protein